MTTKACTPSPDRPPLVLLLALGTGLGLLGLLLGCASVETPDLELEPPERFAAADDAADPSPEPDTASALEEAPADTWWTDFDDPILDDVIVEALENNPGIDIAIANFDAALARARIEGSALYPDISAGLDGARRKQNFIGFPIPGGGGEVLSTTATTLGLNLNVSWEADLWGRLRAARAAAVAEAQATETDLIGTYLSLSAQTAKVYLAVVEGKLQVSLAESTLDSFRTTERRVEARYQRGLSPALELRLARTQTAGVEASLALRERALDISQRQLETLLGRYPEASITAADDLPPVPAALEPGLPADLLRRRPDLIAAEQRALSSTETLRSATAALYPRLALTGSAGTVSGELEDLVDGDFSVWSLAGNLLQPIFQGGRLRANVAFADAGLDRAVAAWLQTTLDAYREVEIALASELTLDDQVQALQSAATESRAAERLALDRYTRGLDTYLSVLESQRSAFTAESELLNARRERLEARIDLILALGGPPRGDGTAAGTAPQGEQQARALGAPETPIAHATDSDSRQPF